MSSDKEILQRFLRMFVDRVLKHGALLNSKFHGDDFFNKSCMDADSAYNELMKVLETPYGQTEQAVREATKRLEMGVLASGEPTRTAQLSLMLLNYNPGPVDGIPGPRTLAAIRGFCESRGFVLDVDNMSDVLKELADGVRVRLNSVFYK